MIRDGLALAWRWYTQSRIVGIIGGGIFLFITLVSPSKHDGWRIVMIIYGVVLLLVSVIRLVTRQPEELVHEQGPQYQGLQYTCLPYDTMDDHIHHAIVTTITQPDADESSP